MTEFTQSVTEWGLHTAVAGAAVFGLGWAWVRRVSDPARRQQLARWVVCGGLLAAVLCLLPAWLVLPVSLWGEPSRETAAVSESPAPLHDTPPTDIHEPLSAERSEADRLVMPLPPTLDDDAVLTGPEPPTDLRNSSPFAAEAGGRDSALSTQYEGPGAPRSQLLTPAQRAGQEHTLSSESAIVSPWPGIVRLVLIAYTLAVVVAVVPLLLGAVALGRLRRHSKPAPAHVQAIFDELATGLRVRLLVADRLASPVCFGLLRPVVLLPKELAKTATDTELRWVFAHELNHLRRGDAWMGWWVGLAKAVYFAVPWFWRVKRDLALTQEYLADAAAAAAGGQVEDYAAFLVRLSEGPGGRRHPVGAAAVRAGKSDLFRRVSMLLASNERAALRASRWWTVGVAVCVLGAVVVVSGVGFAQPNDDPPKPRSRTTEAEPADQAKPDRPVSPELAALRKAIEDAEKMGANVTEIRKRLEALEKSMSGPRVIEREPDVLVPRRVRVNPDVLVPAPVRVTSPDVLVPGRVRVNPDVLVPAPVRVTGQPDPQPQPALRRVAQPDPNVQVQMAELRAKVAELQAKADALKAGGQKEEAENLLKQVEDLRKRAAELDALTRQTRPAEPLFRPDRAPVPVWSATGGGFESRLGIVVDRVSPVLADQLDLPKGQGLVVSGVLREQAADKAGLKSNDILLEFNGKPVSDNPADFFKVLSEVKTGDKVNVVVLRKGKKETIKGIEVPEAKRSTLPPGQPFAPGAVPPAPAVPAVPSAPLVPSVPGRPRTVAPPAVPAPLTPAFPPGGGTQRSIEVRVENDTFTLKADEDGVKFTMTGTVGAGGKAVPTKIEITDGGKKIDATSVEKVPAAYRDRVQKILDSVKVGN